MILALLVVMAITTQNAFACPEGYTCHVYGNSEYALIPSNLPQNLNAQALALGGHLAVIPDEDTNTFLYDTFGSVNVYFGYTDSAQEGIWQWVDGSQSMYTNWNPPFEPNNYGGEHWAMLYKGLNGKWLDHRMEAPGIVQFPILSGCTSPTACNYDATASTDDGSCIEPGACDTCSGETVVDGDTNNNGVCDDAELQSASECETLKQEYIGLTESQIENLGFDLTHCGTLTYE